MPKIEFTKKHPPIVVAKGANLMKSLLDHGVPVASSCNGQGVCSKCRLRIVSGTEKLTPENEFERTLRDRLHIKKEFRISCQAQVLGDITIDADYW